jgi:hypothetical protein
VRGLVGAADLFTHLHSLTARRAAKPREGGCGDWWAQPIFSHTFTALPHGGRHRPGRVGAGISGRSRFFHSF